MRIAVAGTINRDTILLLDGTRKESYGGLLYSILTLALLAEKGSSIHPVVNLGRDVEGAVKNVLSRYPQVCLNGLHPVEEKNNHAILTYHSQDEREEILKGGVPPLTFEHLVPFLDADALLVNFISGCDLSLKTLKRVRKNSAAAIYMDIHSLSLGIDHGGRRFLRPLPDWTEWMAQADVVQVNRGEARLLCGSQDLAEGELIAFGKAVTKAGPSVLLITLGAQGSVMFTALEGNIHLERYSPQPASEVRDTTGCGDVFLAAFMLEHSRSGDPRKASEYANLVAGAKSGLSGIEALSTLGKFQRI